jgi:DNA replication protein DnaC
MLKTFEAFAGVGSQVMALRNLGIKYKTVGISEIDKFATQSYELIHGKTKNYGDILKINWQDVDDIDLFTYLTKFELENKTFQKYESTGKRAEFRSAVVKAVRDNKNIILKGKSGTGKSHLAIAIIINGIEKNIIAGKFTWHNLKVKFSEFFSEENIQDMFWKYKIILIDEYMIEKMSTTLYNNFLQFLEFCLNNKKQLIITTNNFEINDLKEDDRLYRRMNACIDIIIDTNNIPVYEKKLNIEVVKL